MKTLITISILYCMFLSSFVAFGQFTWKHGIDIGMGINAIGVGYQDFTSLGLGSNFPKKGASEFSSLVPFWGIHIMHSSQNHGFRLRTSFDNRSGVMQDELTIGSKSMKPILYYLTNDITYHYSAFPSLPALHVYVGPSISFLLKNSIYLIDDIPNNQAIPAMNTIVPGLIGGITYTLPFKANVLSFNPKISTFIEMSWMLNQRAGEYVINNNGLANIWSTVAIRAGISLQLQAK